MKKSENKMSIIYFFSLIPNIYDDSIFENRINQLFDFEFKKWDIDTIEKNSICTIENTIALIEKAPTVIKKIFIDDFYHR